MTRPPPELVIFDCDGVLVDSEPIANRVMAEAVTALGWPMDAEESTAHFKGWHLDKIMDLLAERLGRPLPESWLPDLRQATHDAFRAELEPIPGALPVIEALRQRGIAYCVASQGPPEKMAVSLGKTGLWPLFEDCCFSAYQVERGKPHPDLFLHAAQAMGKPAADAVVIEDSILGVQAAGAANMPVFGYVPPGDPEGLGPAGAVLFHDMTDLPALLRIS